MTMNDLEEGPGGPHQGPAPKELPRSSKSRMRLAGLMETAEEKTKGKPPVVRAAVMAEVEKLDRNEDGVVDGGELADALVSICKGSLAAGRELAAEKKKSAMLRAGALLAVVAAVVMGAVGFGSNVAATRMEKDARVQGGGSTALVTRDLKAVSTNTNEVQSTLALLPWLSVETRSHVDKVDFMVPDEEGAFERHERVAAVDIQTRESVRVTTVLGTTVQWNRKDKENVFVTLADGSSWTAPAACQKCLVLNILDSEEVSEAKDLFHQDVGMALHQEGRLLKGDPCLPAEGGAPAVGGGSKGLSNADKVEVQSRPASCPAYTPISWERINRNGQHWSGEYRFVERCRSGNLVMEGKSVANGQWAFFPWNEYGLNLKGIAHWTCDGSNEDSYLFEWYKDWSFMVYYAKNDGGRICFYI